MPTPALMILGTSSHVGKSLLTAALCRIYANAGLSVAPFKSQNMSLNSAATIEGLEIGRAQALQAEAARLPASVCMNPILIKPTGDSTSQIIVRGKVWGKLSASQYHRERVMDLLPIVRECYESLSQDMDLVVLEGAGSPAEINLKENDIVNMRMAEMADAACVLVGDIDRGGVFASLLGTLELLDEEERKRIRGFIVNKFRGDLNLLLPGIEMFEKRIGIPCLGVIPYIGSLKLEEEDSVGLEVRAPARWHEDANPSRHLRVAVVCLPSLSNFTDFDSLCAEPSVSVAFCRTPEEMRHADVVILPGSKQTVEDLLWLRKNHIAERVREHAVADGLVVGICGGLQMLGIEIVDPEEMESGGTVEGLALLPIKTRLLSEKVTVRATGKLLLSQLFGQKVTASAVSGYEIHLGITSYFPGAAAFARIERATGSQEEILDGCVSADGRVFGSYLHGLFDDDSFRHDFIRAARASCRLHPPSALEAWRELREGEWKRLVEVVSSSLDFRTMNGWLGYEDVVMKGSAREGTCAQEP